MNYLVLLPLNHSSGCLCRTSSRRSKWARSSASWVDSYATSTATWVAWSSAWTPCNWSRLASQPPSRSLQQRAPRARSCAPGARRSWTAPSCVAFTLSISILLFFSECIVGLIVHCSVFSVYCRSTRNAVTRCRRACPTCSLRSRSSEATQSGRHIGQS